MIIAVDFDGCLFEDKYPNVGKPNKYLINYLIRARTLGDEVILWTCRTGKYLKEAIKCCKMQGLKFDAIYGLFFNVPWWSLVHQQLFFILKKKYPEIKLGNMEANIHSSHVYLSKLNLVKNILSENQNYHWYKLMGMLPVGESFEWYIKNMKNFWVLKKQK